MKYCDLVMKGGITSGIVYPNAVLELSGTYRFKNIGGTSAGAIAAGLVAAASYGDRHLVANPSLSDPSQMGFAGLRAVSKELQGKGFIFRLFQPARGLRGAFGLIVLLTGQRHPASKIPIALLRIPLVSPVAFAVTAAAMAVPAYLQFGSEGLKVVALPALLCSLAVAGIAVVLKIAHIARRTMLGICTGMPTAKKGTALTQWLHDRLQTLSGKPGDKPLTFEDLVAAPAYPDEPRPERAIDLRMITTDISHHEPRSVPFENGQFWFRDDEFGRLFPIAVVEALKQAAGTPVRYGEHDYFKLPAGERLPVLVGMRMSLSFPLLLSAVPLHETRRSSAETSGGTTKAVEGVAVSADLLASSDALATAGEAPVAPTLSFKPCWFTDGGIASNFPIHLFDAALPRWPTFAINLVDKHPDSTRDDVFLPTENGQGWQRTYKSFADRSAFVEVTGFVFAILATMQNWRDLLQARAPGHRDRIVHVALTKEQGGLNLDMPVAVLEEISAKGARAGTAFGSFSFENHYWVRWRNLVSGLQRYTRQAAENAKSPIAEYASGYDTAKTGDPAPPSYAFTSKQGQAAQRLLGELELTSQEWEDAEVDLTDGAPRPLPHLRITPTY